MKPDFVSTQFKRIKKLKENLSTEVKILLKKSQKPNPDERVTISEPHPTGEIVPKNNEVIPISEAQERYTNYKTLHIKKILPNLESETSKSKLLDQLLDFTDKAARSIFESCNLMTLEKIISLGACNPHYKLAKNIADQRHKKFQYMSLEKLIVLPPDTEHYDDAKKFTEKKLDGLLSSLSLNALINIDRLSSVDPFFKELQPHLKAYIEQRSQEFIKEYTKKFITEHADSIPLLEGQYTIVLARNLEETFRLTEKQPIEIEREFAKAIFSRLSPETLENIRELEGSKIMPSPPHMDIVEDCLAQKQTENDYLFHKLPSPPTLEKKISTPQEIADYSIGSSSKKDAETLDSFQETAQISEYLAKLFLSPIQIKPQSPQGDINFHPKRNLNVLHRDYAIAIFSQTSIKTLETISTLEGHPISPYIEFAKRYLDDKKNNLPAIPQTEEDKSVDNISVTDKQPSSNKVTLISQHTPLPSDKEGKAIAQYVERELITLQSFSPAISYNIQDDSSINNIKLDTKLLNSTINITQLHHTLDLIFKRPSLKDIDAKAEYAMQIWAGLDRGTKRRVQNLFNTSNLSMLNTQNSSYYQAFLDRNKHITQNIPHSNLDPLIETNNDQKNTDPQHTSNPKKEYLEYKNLLKLTPNNIEEYIDAIDRITDLSKPRYYQETSTKLLSEASLENLQDIIIRIHEYVNSTNLDENSFVNLDKNKQDSLKKFLNLSLSQFASHLETALSIDDLNNQNEKAVEYLLKGEMLTESSIATSILKHFPLSIVEFIGRTCDFIMTSAGSLDETEKNALQTVKKIAQEIIKQEKPASSTQSKPRDLKRQKISTVSLSSLESIDPPLIENEPQNTYSEELQGIINEAQKEITGSHTPIETTLHVISQKTTSLSDEDFKCFANETLKRLSKDILMGIENALYDSELEASLTNKIHSAVTNALHQKSGNE